MKITKYFTFTFLAVTLLTSCSSTQQPIVNNTIKPIVKVGNNEISMEEYDNVLNYSNEMKKLGSTSGLPYFPNEIRKAQREVKRVTKDNTITRTEYNSLNIKENIKKFIFITSKMLKIEEMKK